MKTISKLNASDLPAAWQIEQQSHAFPWSQQTFYSNQGERYRNFKIELEQQLAGFCIIQTVADEASLFNIAILPQFQRQGLARQLLEHAIAELSQQQIKTIWLEVRASNQAAIKLYQQLGFNQITIRHAYYPTQHQQREDAIIMALTLGF